MISLASSCRVASAGNAEIQGGNSTTMIRRHQLQKPGIGSGNRRCGEGIDSKLKGKSDTQNLVSTGDRFRVPDRADHVLAEITQAEESGPISMAQRTGPGFTISAETAAIALKGRLRERL